MFVQSPLTASLYRPFGHPQAYARDRAELQHPKHALRVSLLAAQ